MEPLQTKDYIFLNELSIIPEINNLKLEVDEYRPLDEEKEARIMQKFRLDWNYNSNAIEGNSLDYGETLAFLMHGITAKGKPLKDYLDIRGHNEAISFLQDVVKNKDELRETDVRALHKMLLVEPYKTPAQTVEGVAVQKTIRLGEYKRTDNHVITITGETHYYATPEDTPILMTELMNWYKTAMTESMLHPMIIASVFHHRFTSIHPFDDGNGRMSRLLMNLILMQYTYPPVVIKNSDKKEYYLTLSQADSGDIEPFVKFIATNMLNSLNLYIRGSRGESIEEPSDLRKKITLFKKEVEVRRDKIETKKTFEVQSKILDDSIMPFIESLAITLSDFKEFFLEYKEKYVYISSNTQPAWNYDEGTMKDYINNMFSKSNYTDEDTEYSFCVQFLRFKLAENPFSVEIKILLELEELSYRISYSISEADELKRIGIYRSLYSQWKGTDIIKKYYHQVLTDEDKSRFVNKIGESFLEYIKTGFENQSLLESQLDVSNIIDYWEEFLRKNTKIANNIIAMLSNNAKLKFNSKQATVSIEIPSTDYSALTTDERSTIELDFFRVINNSSKYSIKVFVYTKPL